MDNNTYYLIAFIIMSTILVIYLLLKLSLFIEEVFIKIFHRKIDEIERDPQRVYKQSEKKKMSNYCNNRCEGTGIVFRCKHEGYDLQGDHWYPHSRGGATTMKNLVMLCPKCNKKKTNHVPTFLQTLALSRRRKKYNNIEAILLRPGEWQSRRKARYNKKLNIKKESIDLHEKPYF